MNIVSATVATGVSALLMGLGAARGLTRVAQGAKAVSQRPGIVREDPDALGYFLGDEPSEGLKALVTPDGKPVEGWMPNVYRDEDWNW